MIERETIEEDGFWWNKIYWVINGIKINEMKLLTNKYYCENGKSPQ